MRKSLHIAVCACALVTLLGVVPTAMSQPRPSAHEAVIGGVSAQPGAFASVAEILDIRGKDVGECTGTVVAPTLVLTAGHCAVNMRTGRVNKASGYRVLTAAAPGSAEQQVATVSAVLVYEGFARRVDDRDAALLVLSAPTSAPAVKLAGGGRRARRLTLGRSAGGSDGDDRGLGKDDVDAVAPDRRTAVGDDGGAALAVVPAQCAAVLQAQ